MKYITYMIVLLSANFALAQQDALYTQFMYNKLGLNPAYAGNVEETTITAIHRDQWTGFDGAPQAQALSLNLPAFQESIAFGLNLAREAIGIQQKLTLEGNFAYRFNLSTGSISMGLSSSVRQFENDFSDPRLVAFEDIDIDSSVNVAPSLSESGRFRTDYDLNLKYDLPLDFYIKIGFVLNYDNQPITSGNEVDYVLTTGFGWEFD